MTASTHDARRVAATAARVLMIAALLGVPGIARADLISMSEASCRGAAQGARCEGDSGPGTCQPGRCCRNDYSNGPPPTRVCSDCLTCQSTPAAPAPPAPAPPAPAPDKPTPTPEQPTPDEAAAGGAEEPPAGQKRGCDAVAGGPLGLGALALGLLLAIGLRRTRR